MKKHIVLLLLLVISLPATLAQTHYELGYIINNDGLKTECLIENSDWKFNPVEIKYSLPGQGVPIIASVDNISEFEIYNSSKYVRAEVMIDRSPTEVDELNRSRAPEWSKETLFLKVLVDGFGTLYSYNERGLSLFFFKTYEEGIMQLVHKRYLVTNSRMAENNDFRVQLSQFLYYPGNNNLSAIPLNYTRKDLVNYFLIYNAGMDVDFIDYTDMENKARLSLKLTTGINYSTFVIYMSALAFSSYGGDGDFGPEISLSPGFDVELQLPYNNYKWAIFVAPSYQSFKSETRVKGAQGSGIDTQLAWADYTTIEFPVGFRYYLYLNNSSKFFISGMAIADLILNSTVDFEMTSTVIKGESGFNFGLGLGYEYKRLNLGIQVATRRDLTINYVMLPSDYRSCSFILGYRLIK